MGNKQTTALPRVTTRDVYVASPPQIQPVLESVKPSDPEPFFVKWTDKYPDGVVVTYFSNGTIDKSQLPAQGDSRYMTLPFVRHYPDGGLTVFDVNPWSSPNSEPQSVRYEPGSGQSPLLAQNVDVRERQSRIITTMPENFTTRPGGPLRWGPSEPISIGTPRGQLKGITPPYAPSEAFVRKRR